MWAWGILIDITECYYYELVMKNRTSSFSFWYAQNNKNCRIIFCENISRTFLNCLFACNNLVTSKFCPYASRSLSFSLCTQLDSCLSHPTHTYTNEHTSTMQISCLCLAVSMGGQTEICWLWSLGSMRTSPKRTLWTFLRIFDCVLSQSIIQEESHANNLRHRRRVSSLSSSTKLLLLPLMLVQFSLCLKFPKISRTFGSRQFYLSSPLLMR